MRAQIIRFSELSAAEQAHIMPALRRIFFASSNTQIFVDEAAREAHFDRWLGRYLRHWPGDALVAVDSAINGEALAYLAGCPDSAAAAPVFVDIGYYPLFAAHYADYPAHIHVNAAQEHRGRGHGRALIEVYAEMCCARSIDGLHAVTAGESPAAAFFARCGLLPVSEIEWNSRPLALLGMRV
jgi:GNAT superfamily N-acetyltransferase